MESIEFVELLKANVLDFNFISYIQFFRSGNLETVMDPYWKKALQLYEHIKESEKEVFFMIIKQIEIDTISSLLGIIDGTIVIKENADINLSINVGNKSIGGNLQDQFLEIIENER
jgi:hypothetical protein